MPIILTVSIAAFNVDKYIEKCLKTFVESKCISKIEVLIVDDGSTDNTSSMAEKYAKQHPDNIRVISKENGGWGSTLNVGIHNARGMYFKQLDGDDYFDESTLSSFIQYLSDATDDVIYTPYYLIDDKTGDIISQKSVLQGVTEKTSLLIEDVIQKIPLQMHSCTFKTSLLKENRVELIENCFYTDSEFVIKGIKYANTIAYLNIPVYCYRVDRDGQSMSMEGLKKHYKEHETVIKAIVSLMSDIKGVRKKAFLSKLSGMISLQYIIYLSLDITKEHKNELILFDNYIKNNCSEIYNKSGKTIDFCRKTRFYLYPLFCLYIKLKKIDSAA